MLIASAAKDLDTLEEKLFTQVRDAMLELAENPRPHGCHKLTVMEGYRIRSGNYRILYRIDDLNKQIYIYRIKHRRDVYR
ncbi:MAG TPA: type II toxin-antitoxin system RelE/ParE family toxin [bacterium]|nr:type II toxin-antitoxin system RelE/ParE family toxin [bacterium]